MAEIKKGVDSDSGKEMEMLSEDEADEQQRADAFQYFN